MLDAGSRSEAIDMGRRGLYNEGSQILKDSLGKVEIDFDTAGDRETMPTINTRRDEISAAERGLKNADQVDGLLNVRGKRILEIGCQRGHTTRALVEKYDCEVVGIDIMSHPSWLSLRSSPRITLLEADIANGHPELEPNSFDRIISFVVWEHIRHPWSALQQCQNLLKPDGKKYLYANLYRSAIASHLYRTVPDPWPHLMMSPSEISQKYGSGKIGWAFWVNKLTYQQYLYYFRQLGFQITWESLVQRHFDQDYYDQNEKQLGLYPEWDLKTDFFKVVLEFDPASPKKRIPDPVYRT